MVDWTLSSKLWITAWPRLVPIVSKSLFNSIFRSQLLSDPQRFALPNRLASASQTHLVDRYRYQLFLPTLWLLINSEWVDHSVIYSSPILIPGYSIWSLGCLFVHCFIFHLAGNVLRLDNKWSGLSHQSGLFQPKSQGADRVKEISTISRWASGHSLLQRSDKCHSCFEGLPWGKSLSCVFMGLSLFYFVSYVIVPAIIRYKASMREGLKG